jgi:hypothetical protein
MNSHQLALRDPALAAFTGAISGGDFGASFGNDDYGFGESEGGYEYGFGDESGYEYGAIVPPVRPAIPRPTAQQAMAAWNALASKRAIGHRRKVLLDPNAGSDSKIERYIFSLAQTFTLGTAAAFDSNMSQSPSTDFRPNMVIVNTPAPGFATASSIAIANVLVTVGGTTDLWSFSSGQQGTFVSWPTMTPSNKATFAGNYTGFVPPGYVAAASFTLTVTMTGWASLAGGRMNIGS